MSRHIKPNNFTGATTDDGFGASILWHIVEPINYVMERKMLLGIKARAEDGR